MMIHLAICAFLIGHNLATASFNFFQNPVNSILGLNLADANNPTSSRNPVILVPGYMGSQLEVRLARLNSDYPGCPKNTDHYTDTLWFSLQNYQPYYDDCWVENARLNYNTETRRAYPDQGVFVNPREFGNTTGIEFVSPQPSPQTMYYYNLVQALEGIGYTRDVDMLGAPYDWRRAPHENGEFMTDFRLLVEESFVRNKNKPTIIVCHSMGCMFTYTFLKAQDDLWKATYVKAWFVLAAPMGGNFKYMYGYFGDDDWPATMSRKIRIPERTFSSTTFLMPHKRSFDGDVLIQTPSRNYTIYDYREYFAALGFPNAYEQWLDTKDIMGDELSAPGNFDIYCVGGVGVRSLESAVFESELSPRARYRAVYGDGDGILNAKSMRQCQKFGGGANKFVYQEFNLDHMEIIQHSTSVNYIVKAIGEVNLA